MKKQTIFTIIITLALFVSNFSAAFADSGDASDPAAEPSETAPEVEVFQENENTETVDFTGSELPENWQIGENAQLTADSAIDPEGDGWLRLNGNDSYELGYAVNDQALDTANGLAFKFDYTSWGGSGADGFTFFLMDGETTMEEFNMGGYGGSLGYAPRHKVVEGLSNAVVGIGLDEFGNFSAPIEGRDDGPGRTQNAITVRGAGNEYEGYDYIAGTGKLDEELDVRNVTERPDQTGKDYRNVSIMFTPVEQQFSLTLTMQFGAESEPEELFKDLLLPGIIPATVKFGFTAASGGATNNHEVRNLIVDKAVLNDIIETAKEEPAKTKKTVSVPVTAIQSGDTMTIIPVTGTDLHPLSCNAQSKLDIADQVYAILPALCGQEASLVLETLETMPFALPAAYTFINASTLAIMDSATFTSYPANGEQIEVGFYIDKALRSDSLSILVWQDGQWVEQEVVIADGIISTFVEEGSIFVLAQK